MLPSLVLSMIVCAVLGMGLPTTAAYIVVATAIAPALTGLGVPTLAAHLFLFYFASLSAITPPVAVAAYAGSRHCAGEPHEGGTHGGKDRYHRLYPPVRLCAESGLHRLQLGFPDPFDLDLRHRGGATRWRLCSRGMWKTGLRSSRGLGYMAAICLAITPWVLPSVAGWVLFGVLYGLRKLEAKKKAAAAA